MADYRAVRTAFLKPIEVARAPPMPRALRRRAPGLPEADGVLCEWEARRGCWRPMASARCLPPGSSTPPRRRVEAAAAIGAPVALKIQSTDIPAQETEVGGVRLNLASPEGQVGPAYGRSSPLPRRTRAVGAHPWVLVQATAPPGLR